MKTRWLVAILFALYFSLGIHRMAFAHGHTMVGDYEIVIGFHNEPAIQGEPNGLDLFVTNSKTGKMVNDLDSTLKAEILFGGSKKALNLEAQWGQDGAYTAYVLPTEAGDYTWHIFGSIEGTPIDVSMTSSPTTFSSVEAKSTISFPAVEPSTGLLQSQSAMTDQTARMALIVGGIGGLLGLVGIAFGGVAIQTIRRQNKMESGSRRKENAPITGFSQK